MLICCIFCVFYISYARRGRIIKLKAFLEPNCGLCLLCPRQCIPWPGISSFVYSKEMLSGVTVQSKHPDKFLELKSRRSTTGFIFTFLYLLSNLCVYFSFSYIPCFAPSQGTSHVRPGPL